MRAVVWVWVWVWRVRTVAARRGPRGPVAGADAPITGRGRRRRGATSPVAGLHGRSGHGRCHVGPEHVMPARWEPGAVTSHPSDSRQHTNPFSPNYPKRYLGPVRPVVTGERQVTRVDTPVSGWVGRTRHDSSKGTGWCGEPVHPICRIERSGGTGRAVGCRAGSAVRPRGWALVSRAGSVRLCQADVAPPVPGAGGRLPRGERPEIRARDATTFRGRFRYIKFVQRISDRIICAR